MSRLDWRDGTIRRGLGYASAGICLWGMAAGWLTFSTAVLLASLPDTAVAEPNRVLALQCAISDNRFELNFDRKIALWKGQDDGKDLVGSFTTRPDTYELFFELKTPAPPRSWKWSVNRQTGQSLMWFNGFPEDKPLQYECQKASLVACSDRCLRDQERCDKEAGDSIRAAAVCGDRRLACKKKCDADKGF